MQKIIFGLLLLLSPYCAHALTIKGKVTDKNTGEELIGAYVSVKENTKLVSVTGLDGSYSFGREYWRAGKCRSRERFVCSW